MPAFFAKRLKGLFLYTRNVLDEAVFTFKV
jgi:hypothetical protein